MQDVAERRDDVSREYHKDGSYTDRSSDGSSITYGPDGKVRESVRDESSNPFSIIPVVGDVFKKDMRVTRDSEGNISKAEWKK